VLAPGQLVQQFIDKHLGRMGIAIHPCGVFNFLDTQIAMVEAGEGIRPVPTISLPSSRAISPDGPSAQAFYRPFCGERIRQRVRSRRPSGPEYLPDYP
jgi:hypothetical protein